MARPSQTAQDQQQAAALLLAETVPEPDSKTETPASASSGVPPRCTRHDRLEGPEGCPQCLAEGRASNGLRQVSASEAPGKLHGAQRGDARHDVPEPGPRCPTHVDVTLNEKGQCSRCLFEASYRQDQHVMRVEQDRMQRGMAAINWSEARYMVRDRLTLLARARSLLAQLQAPPYSLSDVQLTQLEAEVLAEPRGYQDSPARPGPSLPHQGPPAKAPGAGYGYRDA